MSSILNNFPYQAADECKLLSFVIRYISMEDIYGGYQAWKMEHTGHQLKMVLTQINH